MAVSKHTALFPIELGLLKLIEQVSTDLTVVIPNLVTEIILSYWRGPHGIQWVEVGYIGQLPRECLVWNVTSADAESHCSRAVGHIALFLHNTHSDQGSPSKYA